MGFILIRAHQRGHHWAVSWKVTNGGRMVVMINGVVLWLYFHVFSKQYHSLEIYTDTSDCSQFRTGVQVAGRGSRFEPKTEAWSYTW